MFAEVADLYDSAVSRRRLRAGGAATVREWCDRELAAWRGRDVDDDALHVLNATRPWLFLFTIGRSGAAVVAKPPDVDDGGPHARRRLGYYLPFLDRVARQACLTRPITIAVDLNDEPTACDDVPVFAFQKRRGARNVLIPDVEFLQPDHNALPSWLTFDRTPWRAKRDGAVFAGSTTGGVITAELVRSLGLPRLRAGAFFRGAADVDFRLPNLVECDTPETEAMLRAMGFGVGAMSWQEQFRHRFIISMDGNGATCSRVVVALRSHSVLLKYASDRVLYYFHGLAPGQHYVPIATDADVLRTVAAARTDPGPYRAINAAARRFAGAFLTRRAVEHYMAALLQGYAAVVSRR